MSRHLRLVSTFVLTYSHHIFPVFNHIISLSVVHGSIGSLVCVQVTPHNSNAEIGRKPSVWFENAISKQAVKIHKIIFIDHFIRHKKYLNFIFWVSDIVIN